MASFVLKLKLEASETETSHLISPLSPWASPEAEIETGRRNQALFHLSLPGQHPNLKLKLKLKPGFLRSLPGSASESEIEIETETRTFQLRISTLPAASETEAAIEI